ncbi:hypothetical protein BCE_2209 [Bacillus cereus ATCC 10987]|uniref:Uncharacterized protein n=1 Tax=Bacillus cereus (strain ATCC 10987 / NRS 248) TaxID=222523 RepID=Q739D3_BACC1|nr:hypothetical protein BCE_2209 [Bacillus cereus ATCC 10987]
MLNTSITGLLPPLDCPSPISKINLFSSSVFTWEEIVDLLRPVISDSFALEMGEFFKISFNISFWFIFLTKVWSAICMIISPFVYSVN